MRRLVFFLAALAAVVCTSVLVSAEQTVEGETSGQAGIADSVVSRNLDALPGTFRVASAADLSAGLALGLTAGYGYFEDVLELEDSHHRMRATLAGSYRLLPWLAAGIRVDGRYDRHRSSGVGADDGYVGEGRLTLHVAKSVTPVVGLGIQVAAWVPALDGLSFYGRGLATISAGSAAITANAGFRFDRSGEAIDNADMLSRSDRLALGASDSNAVLLGLAVAVPVGKFDLFVEGTWDLLIGADAPPAIESPLRIGFGVAMPISDSYRAAAILEGSFGRVPFVDVTEPLVPVEPLVALNISISGRLIGGERPSFSQTVEPIVETTNPKADRLPARDRRAGLGGTVRDQEGQPISGAVVRVAEREVITAESGTFVAERLAPGEIVVSVSANGFEDAQETVTIGDDKVLEINLILKKRIVGTLRGVVQGFDGKPVLATIVVATSSGTTVESITSTANGRFNLKLAPGKYSATATAVGFRARSTSFTIKVPGPVVILNLDLLSAGGGKN